MKIQNIIFQNIQNTKFQQKNKNSSNSIKINQKYDFILPYYTTLPFQRSWQEHKSWGANFDSKNSCATFKIFAYPNANSVDVEILRGEKYITYPLKNKGKGIFETNSPIQNIKEGDKYHYVIEYYDGVKQNVKDPYSFKQDTLDGDSVIYNQKRYNWQDKNWYLNKERITRNNNDNGINNLRIYEINCATLTKEGTFNSAKQKIKEARQNGFNAIEIMPVENTYSFNWGYDGTDKFAVSNYLGGADELKSLVDFCHNTGINVIIDMVPNHLGPDGAQLHKTGPYIKGHNDFGGAFNFEYENSEYVRDYMVNAALNWIDNFHCDGIRFDMTKFMDSDITMKQIASEINYHRPDTFLIAEDARSNIETDGNYYWTNPEKLHDERVIYPLNNDDIGCDDSSHNQIIQNIMNTNVARLGFDSEWDFDFFHSLHDYIFNNIGLDRLENAAFYSQNRVKYIMSHDEIGNFDGTRLISKLLDKKLNLNRFVQLSQEDENRINNFSQLKNVSHTEARRIVTIQKSQLVAEKLAIALQTGKIKDNSDIYNLGVNENSEITIDTLKQAYKEAISKQKAAFAFTYAIPGPKMVFQGDEKADLTPFRFFREFSDNSEEKNLTIEKGYTAGKSALIESKCDGIDYSKEAKQTMQKHLKLLKDLNDYKFKNPQIIRDNTVIHQLSNIISLNIKCDDSEYVVITNFSDTDYPNQNADDYYIEFPIGQWQEVLNTNDKKYGGDGLSNKNDIKSTNENSKPPIKLPANSTLYFKKV